MGFRGFLLSCLAKSASQMGLEHQARVRIYTSTYSSTSREHFSFGIAAYVGYWGPGVLFYERYLYYRYQGIWYSISSPHRSTPPVLTVEILPYTILTAPYNCNFIMIMRGKRKEKEKRTKELKKKEQNMKKIEKHGRG
ncbi:hypothetical protein DFH27DRAFT_551540 [Peziza echinospora]|nr:hypothetical protein DFH27DRAFT_551540 [Peziza echinospora]